MWLVSKKKYLIILSLFLCGCVGTIQNWKRNPETGKMELIQELKAKGFQDIKGKFDDKSKIDKKAYKPIPQIPIKDLEVNQ